MKDRVKELELLIIKHKSLYYQGTPEISDAEFDKLELDLKKIDPENPILNLIGTEVKSSNKVSHKTKMLSLDKVYEIDELKKWVDNKAVVSTYKIDGISCSLVYEKGKLSVAKTRGDGSVGENITSKIMWIEEIPKSLGKNSIDCEIRGELYCSEKNFVALAEKMIELKLDRPSSQRNIVAGLMGRKDHLELSSYLNFKAFDILSEEKTFKEEIDKSHFLKKMHFDTPPIELHKNFKSLEQSIEEAQEFMSEGDYQIDGLVITINEISLQNELGETAHHPKYKMAFKFPGEAKETTIVDIEWSVSRNGILTPVALVSPIELSGAVVSRVTLHNYGMVKINNLKKGDLIEIIRSGEVIPKFLSVKKEAKGEFTKPRQCPSCDGPLSEVDIRLICNNEKCPVRVRESINNFVKKIGIEDLSEKRLDEMIRKGLVSAIPDLYRLSTEMLLTLDKTKEKLANKIYENINKSKNVELIAFLSSLGIQGGAYNKCEKVVHAGYETLEKVMTITIDQLIDIDGFAEKSATDFYQSLKEKQGMVNELIELGMTIKSEEKFESKVTGLKICITGALSEKRTVIEDRIRKNGGIVVSSVSKNTDLLVTNEQTSSSSKFIKAGDLGIKVITEEQLRELMQS